MIIQQQLGNPYGCPVLTLSMGATITGTAVDETETQLLCSGAPISLEEATSGKYRIMFLHPEASATDSGQRLLRELSKKSAICGLVIDEVHQVADLRVIVPFQF